MSAIGLWSEADGIYARHSEVDLVGQDLWDVARCLIWVVQAPGLDVRSGIGLTKVVQSSWASEKERARFDQWKNLIHKVEASGHNSDEYSALFQQGASMLANNQPYATDTWAREVQRITTTVAANGPPPLTELAALTFANRTVQLATAIALGTSTAAVGLPEERIVLNSANYTADHWAAVNEDEKRYVASAPVWDNNLFHLNHEWWSSYRQLFWKLAAHQEIARRFVPGFGAMQAALLQEQEHAQASNRQPSEWVDSLIRQNTGNSNTMIQIYKDLEAEARRNYRPYSAY